MSARTIFRVLEETASKYGPLAALHQPVGSKKYRTYTWNEYRDIAQEIACGLRMLGIGKGDFVALHSETRAEFYLADLGIVANGSIAAALYTSLPPSEHVRPVRMAEPRAVFAESKKDVKSLREAGVGVPGMIWIVLSGDAPEGCLTLDQLREKGRSTDPQMFERIQAEVGPDDHAILYMTSGATGQPKMGLVTHWAVVSNIEMGPKVIDLGPKDSVLAFLPSAHIAQRVGIEFLPLVFGCPVYFSEGLAKMPNELKEIKPTFFLAPPRVWERVYASISGEIRKRPRAVRKLFYGALGIGLKAADLRQRGEPVPAWIEKTLALADKMIFKKIRDRLGGRLRLAVSGAAPLGRELGRFYAAIGLPLIEGYGLTEGGIVSLNPIEAPRVGSIGKPLPGVEMKLGEDNELLIRSTTVFSGYHRDPEATATVLRDGWLHTGDIAEMDGEGYVFITGRKKELIVSSNGKKIYPARIESLFKVEPVVNQILLVGDRQPYVTALVTVNAVAVEGRDAKQEVDQAVKRVNQQLADFERIRRFRVLEEDFSIERGELTPTMKVRRTQVLENYKHLVNELYLGKEEMV